MGMKRIIKGKSYDTETATRLYEIFAAEPSDGWHGLYQTTHGEFFEIMVDHDGSVMKFGPVADAEAKKLLEKFANHLVEQFFGEMPEGGASERRLIIRVPADLADRLELVAKAQGQSLNAYAMRCFERCLAVDGDPAVQG
jgi:hypothetical protein